MSKLPAKTISEVLGINPVLPGEPAADYQQGLQDLLVELDAQSILQVYLAEKIYDCLWWIRRYESQKRATIIAEMGIQLNGGFSHLSGKEQIQFRETLLANQLDEISLQALAAKGHSIESLQQVAISKRRAELLQLDQQIALQAKILAGFQASYEVAFNRKRNVERLDLQNEILRIDAGALEGGFVDDKRQAKGRKSS